MRGPTYTQNDLRVMVDMAGKGFTCKQIAQSVGRSQRAIECKLKRMGLLFNNESPKEEEKSEKKSLNDFTPREMIKHLYNLGYRIINGKLYQITKVEIKIADIIA